jgi:hypothetical protein
LGSKGRYSVGPLERVSGATEHCPIIARGSAESSAEGLRHECFPSRNPRGAGFLSKARFKGRLSWASLLALALGPVRIVSANVPEYALKGEFIERFTRFIEWPENAFPSPEAPFVFCVVGEDPFGGYLDGLARDRRIKNRTVSISRRTASSDLGDCHLTFIAASEKGKVSGIVARTRGKPILTIGDTTSAGDAGVIINFYLTEDQVRFEINAEEAKRSGLKFSSQLMKLARITGTNE